MQIKNVANQANNLFMKRTSIRKYDSSVKISKEELTNILQDAMTAPSSLNLQPWRFLYSILQKAKSLSNPI